MSDRPSTDRQNPSETPDDRPSHHGQESLMRRRWWLGAAAVGIGAGAAGFWWQVQSSGRGSGGASAPTSGAPHSSRPVQPGQPTISSPERLGDDFWALELPQPAGTELRLATLRGRPLLINFWATWCPPCVREMPLLNSFYRLHQGNGLQMLGIAVDGAKPVIGFLERNPVDFPIALAGADGSGLARALGNTGGGLPYTVLADAGGAILHRQMGEVQATQLTHWARALG